MGRISNFQPLEVWKELHKLVLMVYEITKRYPNEEKFGLATQMRRAAVSIPANIYLANIIMSYAVGEQKPCEG